MWRLNNYLSEIMKCHLATEKSDYSTWRNYKLWVSWFIAFNFKNVGFSFWTRILDFNAFNIFLYNLPLMRPITFVKSETYCLLISKVAMTMMMKMIQIQLRNRTAWMNQTLRNPFQDSTLRKCIPKRLLSKWMMSRMD